MNAPLPSLSRTTRDPFAAFVCDPKTLETLRPVAETLGWRPEKCHDGGLRNAVQTLAVADSPAILMVDLSESGDPLADVLALSEVCEPGTFVLAIGHLNDVRLYRDLLSSGIQDYLVKPLSADQLREALTAAHEIVTAPRPQEPAVAVKHQAIAVVGARGGVGASTVASSLAWLFSTDHALPTALLDLDVHFGTDALALDLEPGRGLSDAIENPGRIDGLFLERAMLRSNERLAVLASETPLDSPVVTDGGAFMRLEEELRQSFEASVVDLPRSILITFPNLIATANAVVLVTELTLAGARDVIRILPWIKRHGPEATMMIVANKVHPGAGEVSRADFEASVESKIAFELPFDAKGAAAAARLGKTFAEANAKTKAGQTLREIASTLLGGDAAAAVADTTRGPTLLARFGELSKLRPGRRKG